MRYAVVIERASSNFSAYVPDLPGCVATGTTRKEVEASIRVAIDMHLEGMREDGVVIPTPSSEVEYVAVDTWKSLFHELGEFSQAVSVQNAFL